MHGLDPIQILVSFAVILISLTIHEFAHAWVANYMGDPTPGRHDRLNLNPMTIIQAHPNCSSYWCLSRVLNWMGRYTGQSTFG